MSATRQRRWLLFLLLVGWGLGYIAVFVWLVQNSRDYVTAGRIDAVCNPVRPDADLSQGFTSADAGATRNMLAAGWSSPASAGVWSADRHAVLALPVPVSLAQHRAALQFEVRAALNHHVPRMEVEVDVAGKPGSRWQFGRNQPHSDYRMEFAPGELVGSRCVEIHMHFPHAYRPAKLGAGGDRRLLGVELKRVTWVDLGRVESAPAETAGTRP
jgi:hypothetical protein